MTDKSVHDATEEWVRRSITKEFTPIDINDVYKAFEAGAQWQSQQAKGEPVAFARMLGGEVDWDENCLFPDAETGISDLDGRGDSDEYEIVPLYRHPPVLANMPEQGEHTKPVADAVKHLNDWLSMGLCGCEGPGHSCGATQIRNTIEALEKLLNAPPTPAAVPEGWHISRTEGGDIIVQKSHVAGFVASEKSGGIAESTLYYLADDLLTASPAPDHIADVRKMVAPDVSELEKAAQTLWRESYSCESDFIQAVVDAFSKQEEEEPVVQQHYPCGCVTCICEDDVQCQGCGGTSCDDFKGPSCGCAQQEEAER